MGKYLMIFLAFLFGCAAPAQFVPKEIPEAKFESTKPYSIDLSSITKPEKLKPIFVDKEFQRVEAEEAHYILLVPREYAKIAGLLKLCKAYKGIIMEQESLVNTHIQVINSLKEYVAMEQMKAEEYRQLWADSENAYRQERHSGKINEAVNKGLLGFISIGSIIALILAL